MKLRVRFLLLMDYCILHRGAVYHGIFLHNHRYKIKLFFKHKIGLSFYFSQNHCKSNTLVEDVSNMEVLIGSWLRGLCEAYVYREVNSVVDWSIGKLYSESILLSIFYHPSSGLYFCLLMKGARVPR